MSTNEDYVVRIARLTATLLPYHDILGVRSVVNHIYDGRLVKVSRNRPGLSRNMLGHPYVKKLKATYQDILTKLGRCHNGQQ